MWFCLRIYICLVYSSIDVHSLPLSHFLLVHSCYLYFSGENCTFLCHSSQFHFVIFSYVPSNIQPLLFISKIFFFHAFLPGCSSIYALQLSLLFLFSLQVCLVTFLLKFLYVLDLSILALSYL